MNSEILEIEYENTLGHFAKTIQPSDFPIISIELRNDVASHRKMCSIDIWVRIKTANIDAFKDAARGFLYHALGPKDNMRCILNCRGQHVSIYALKEPASDPFRTNLSSKELQDRLTFLGTKIP